MHTKDVDLLDIIRMLVLQCARRKGYEPLGPTMAWAPATSHGCGNTVTNSIYYYSAYYIKLYLYNSWGYIKDLEAIFYIINKKGLLLLLKILILI